MDKITLGIVVHRSAAAYVRAAQYAPHVEVTAVADLDFALARSVAEEYGVAEAYESLDALLASSKCDAVVLATPIPDHADDVVQALQAGKHVLSEVTCCTRLEDLPRIAEAVRASGKRYMLAENYVYIYSWTIVRNMAKEGLFGEIYYAESDYLMDFQQRPHFPEGLQPWRKEVYFGRHGHPYITHTLGPLAHIMGEKIATVSCMEAGHQYDLVSPNTCVLMMQTEKGHLIRLRNSFVCARRTCIRITAFRVRRAVIRARRSRTDFTKCISKGYASRTSGATSLTSRAFCRRSGACIRTEV